MNYKIKIEIKKTTTTVIKNELKYSPISEFNTYIAKPNLVILPLRLSNSVKDFLFSFFLLKVLKNDVLSDGNDIKQKSNTCN